MPDHASDDREQPGFWNARAKELKEAALQPGISKTKAKKLAKSAKLANNRQDWDLGVTRDEAVPYYLDMITGHEYSDTTDVSKLLSELCPTFAKANCTTRRKIARLVFLEAREIEQGTDKGSSNGKRKRADVDTKRSAKKQKRVSHK